jgi:CRP/FNR family transcriptional regulator
LDGLSEDCSAVLSALGKRMNVVKGGKAWAQGETAHGIAIVLSGKVMSEFESRSGRLGTVGFWCCGDVIGLNELAQRVSRQHTARCLEPSSFLLLSFADVDALVARFPDFAQALVKALANRLSWVTQLALALETSSANERICAVLLALADRFGRQDADGLHVDIKLTNEQLAAIAGVTRQFANETLRSLRVRGLVGAGRQLILTDLAELQRLAFS